MKGVDTPKNDTKEKRALSPSEAARLLSTLDVADNHQFAISLILRCGLRRGEVCELEWRDVGDTIHVRREITKSDAGVRDIPLDKETKRLISKRRKLVESELKSVSSKLYETDKLCCGLDGRPLIGDALRRWWERKRKEKPYKLDGWTLHELRHTYLTNLAQAGVHPAIMQKLAGHSSLTTTMKIYTHVNGDDMQRAMESLAKMRENKGQI